MEIREKGKRKLLLKREEGNQNKARLAFRQRRKTSRCQGDFQPENHLLDCTASSETNRVVQLSSFEV